MVLERLLFWKMVATFHSRGEHLRHQPRPRKQMRGLKGIRTLFVYTRCGVHTEQLTLGDGTIIAGTNGKICFCVQEHGGKHFLHAERRPAFFCVPEGIFRGLLVFPRNLPRTTVGVVAEQALIALVPHTQALTGTASYDCSRSTSQRPERPQERRKVRVSLSLPLLRCLCQGCVSTLSHRPSHSSRMKDCEAERSTLSRCWLRPPDPLAVICASCLGANGRDRERELCVR